MKSRLCLLALLALPLSSLSHGADARYPQDEPKILLKIVTALENSGIEELDSNKTPGEGENTTYHLCSADFLGVVERNGGKFTIALAFYRRSSPPDGETPPARGHSFIVVLDKDWKVVGHGRPDVDGGIYMLGDKLYSKKRGELEGKEVADFASTSPQIRHGGYYLLNLEYPFPDRISDEDWDAGNFEGAPKEK